MEYDSELKFGYKDELATKTQQYKHAQTTKKRTNYRSSFRIPLWYLQSFLCHRQLKEKTMIIPTYKQDTISLLYYFQKV